MWFSLIARISLFCLYRRVFCRSRETADSSDAVKFHCQNTSFFVCMAEYSTLCLSREVDTHQIGSSFIGSTPLFCAYSGVIHTLMVSRTRDSSDAVKFHSQNTLFFLCMVESYPFAGNQPTYC